MKTILVDIDGTLADCSHRLHLIRTSPKRWEEFFALAPQDPPYQEMVDMVKLFVDSPDWNVIFITGRNESHRDLTVNWLLDQGLADPSKDVPAEIRMRPAEDYRPDFVVKKEMYDQIKEEGIDPVIVIDDLREVVQMWQGQPIRCLQVHH